ncbi:MAG: DHH family phosphoesterase [Halanaeroarchaeum sp.]
MGTCIICGKPTDGEICQTHEEDVFFEFHGRDPEDLTPGRFYRGSVDGFAEFGVFVDIGPVTGLLHRSEIPQRLESLEWDAGDDVFVQVLDVHSNGNIDLGWSIRQRERDFRGRLHDPPQEGEDASTSDEERETVTESEPEPRSEPSPVGDTGEDADEAESAASSTEPETVGDGSQVQARRQEAETETEPPDRVEIADLADHLGERVTLEGEVAGVRQTGGPTVFEVADETGAIDCAAFEEAGVRAYPSVEVDDVVRLVGEVERRRGDVQVETESLTVLSGEEWKEIERRLDDAMEARARPAETSLLVDDPEVRAVQDDLVDAATAIRRAVIEARPVIVRHTATLDGYVAGTAIERALLPLIRDEHEQTDAVYHYVDRRPLDDEFYDVDAATGDVTDMLEAADRHDEKHPLFVLVDAGSTRESTDGLELLDIYGAKSVVVDGGYADEAAAATADALVSPTAAGGDPITTGTLGTHLAAVVNASVREDLRHLPAISYWADVPARYDDLAAAAGYDADTLADVRNAVTLEAFYQSYEDKRELIADLFWDERNASLAAPISEQFTEKMESQLDTAVPHLESRNEEGVVFEVLQVDDYTHRYDFPPVSLLLSALHRRRESGAGPRVTVGAKRDEIRVRSTEPVDVRAVAEAVAATLPDAGVTPRGGRDGRIEFLAGERDAVIDAVVTEIANRLG